MKRLDSLLSFQHHRPLIGIGILQNRVKRRHDRHSDIAKELEQMASGGAAVNSEFVLHGKHLDVVDIQEFRGTPVGFDFLFLDSKRTRLG